MKPLAQWAVVLVCAIGIGWAHKYTDEVPVVLGLVLLLSGVLGLVFPSRPWITGFLLGIPVFLVEVLAHFGAISTRYPASAAIPWPALLGLVPGLGGAFFGSAIRHLNRQTNRNPS